jgi:RNA polymerase sigma factor (sigma-70 family)
MDVLTTDPRQAAIVADGPIELLDSAGLNFDEFYEQSHRSVANALALTLSDRDLAAEATDEAMARAFARWDTVCHYANPSGWVYRVGLNWARSTVRRISRRPRVDVVESFEPSMIGDLALAEALESLDIKMRSIVVCRFLLDWSVDQTASALNIKPGTVKSRLHRALKLLERDLDAN